MIYQAEIELSEDCYLCVDIELEMEYVDNSFSYSYGSIDGVHDPGSGYEITGESWDKTKFTDFGNKVIKQWLEENYDQIIKEIK